MWIMRKPHTIEDSERAAKMVRILWNGNAENMLHLEGRNSKDRTRPQISKIGMEGAKGCDNIHLDEKKLYDLLEQICLEQFSIDKDQVIKETISLLRRVLDEDQ